MAQVAQSSMSFAGTTSSYLRVPLSSGLNFGAGDFTITWWQYQTDTNAWPRVFAVGPDNSQIGVSIEGGGYVYFWRYGSPRLVTYLTSYKNTWVNITIARSSSVTYVYVNGVYKDSFSDTTIYTFTQDLIVGNVGNLGPNRSFGGNLYDFYWLPGTALYSGTSDFTVTTPLYSYYPYSLFLSGDGFNGTLGSSVVNSNVTMGVTNPNIPTDPMQSQPPSLSDSLEMTVIDSTISASWSAASGTFTRYEYRVDRGLWPIGFNTYIQWTDNGLSTTVTISDLIPEEEYTLCVRAVNEGPPQILSNTIHTSTPPIPPSMPGSLTLIGGSTQIYGTWSSPVAGTYPISRTQWSFDASNWTDVYSTYVYINEVTNGQTYTLYVRSVSDGPPQTISNVLSGNVTPIGDPYFPGSLTLVPGNGRINASWDTPVAGTYPISRTQWRLDNGTWTNIVGTFVSITGLTNGQTYDVYVRVVSDGPPESSSMLSDSATPSGPTSCWVASGGNLYYGEVFDNIDGDITCVASADGKLYYGPVLSPSPN